MTHETLNVPDIHCGGCVSSIEAAVGRLDGIESVAVKLSDQTVAVSFDEAALTLETIVSAIEDQGYIAVG